MQANFEHCCDDNSDLDLIHRVACRDRVALTTLYRAYVSRLHRFVGRMTSNADLIHETINDVFMFVWGKAADFRGRGRVSTWIMGITYRCALRVMRIHRVHCPNTDQSADRDSSVELAVHRDSGDLLAEGLQCLPESQRLVVELADADGHSPEEIAEILQCAVGTVRARMFRARMKLSNIVPELSGTDGQITDLGGNLRASGLEPDQRAIDAGELRLLKQVDDFLRIDAACPAGGWADAIRRRAVPLLLAYAAMQLIALSVVVAACACATASPQKRKYALPRSIQDIPKVEPGATR